ncbi:MAG: hypothetical protein WCA04_14905 [Geobacteraceae bacterium]
MGKQLARHLSVILMILFAGQGCAMASRPVTSTITGTIRLVGNEPLTHLVLIPGDNPDKTPREQVYLLVGPLTDKLKKQYQSREITLEGSECAAPSPEYSKCFRPSGIKKNNEGKQ